MRKNSHRFIKRYRTPQPCEIPEFDNKYISMQCIGRMIKTGLGGGIFSNSDAERLYIRDLWLKWFEMFRNWEMLDRALEWLSQESLRDPYDREISETMDYLLGFQEIINLDPNCMLVPNISRWENIAGMHEVKKVLEEEIILPVLEADLYQNRNIYPANGVLLYGPPGCGKTFIMESLADELEFNFINIKPSELGSTYIHGSQLRIAETFEMLGEKAPCIAFFDELEALIPSREKGLYHSYTTEVNEFLIQLNHCAEKGIMVIGATNFLHNIDQAALRPGRFDKKIFVGPPDLDARAEAIKIKVKPHPHEHINYISLAEDLEMYTFSDIEHIMNTAIRKSIREKVKITQGLLYEQVLKSSPSLTKEGLGKYFV